MFLGYFQYVGVEIPIRARDAMIVRWNGSDLDSPLLASSIRLPYRRCGGKVTKELIIYCDESVKYGKHFSNFYGGLLVSSDHIDAVRASIASKKAELNLLGELAIYQSIAALQS
jgi:hypothetical protein